MTVRTQRIAAPYRVPPDLHDAWLALADRLGAEPFDLPGWFTASWKAFGRDPAALVTVWSGGTLHGVLALCPGRLVTRTLDHEHAFRDGVLVDDASADVLARWLFGAHRPFIELHRLRRGSPWSRAVMAAARRHDYEMETLDRWTSPFVRLDGTFDAFEQDLKGSLRKTLRRRGRRLAEVGDVSLSVHDGSDRLDELLAAGFRLEASGWKATAGTSLETDPRARAFYRDVAAWAARAGRLRLLFLRVDDDPIAFQMALEANGRMHLLKTGYDPAWARFGPGSQLMHRQLRWAHERGLRVVEVEGRAENHKLDWTDTGHELSTVRCYSKGPLGRVGRGAVRARRRSRRWVRRLAARRPHVREGGYAPRQSTP